jgi:hypothetical protein
MLSALRDLRAGFLSVYPARVFFFRGARLACNECGGYREGLVLSPRRDSMLTLDPPLCQFLLFRRGILSSLGTRMADKSLRLSLEGVLCEARSEKTVESLLGGQIRFGPGSKVFGAPTSMFPLVRQRTVLQP